MSSRVEFILELLLVVECHHYVLYWTIVIVFLRLEVVARYSVDGCKVSRLFVSCRSSFASITTTLPAKNVLLLVPTYQQRYYCPGKMQLVKDPVLSTSLMSTHICCSANNPWSMDFFWFIPCLHWHATLIIKIRNYMGHELESCFALLFRIAELIMAQW